MINRGLEIERLKKEMKKSKYVFLGLLLVLMIIIVAEMIMFSVSMRIGFNHGYERGFKYGYESATRDFFYGTLKTDLMEDKEKVMVVWKNK